LSNVVYAGLECLCVDRIAVGEELPEEQVFLSVWRPCCSLVVAETHKAPQREHFTQCTSKM
jgi:hypothetical protein